MYIPELLKGEVHLPLTHDMVSSAAINLANLFYQTHLNPEDFKETQTFMGLTGLLTLELIDKATNEVQVTFVNKAAVQMRASNSSIPEGDEEELTNWNIIHPVFHSTAYTEWMAPIVQVEDADEIEFLTSLSIGFETPVDRPDGDLAFKLKNLLNHYEVKGHWYSSSLAPLTTAGFKLVYKGPSVEAPENFLVDESDLIVIVEIRYGEEKGFICMKI